MYGLTFGGAGNVTVSSVIGTGTGTLTKDGAGTLTLSGVNTYTGLTTVSAGTLAYGVSNAIADGSSVTISGGTLNMGTYSDTVSSVTLTSGAISGTGTLTSTNGFTMNNTSNTSVTAVLAGSGGLTKTGTGTLTLSGANTYTGTTTISAGTLAYGANNVISNSSNVTISGGTLNLGAYSDTVGTVTLTGGSILSTGGILTSTGGFVINSNTDTTVSAVLAGAVGLTKSGTGKATLSGTNTYTGVTTITAGTISVATIGNGDVAGNLGQASNAAGNLVFDGGTLQYTGATASTDRSFTIIAGKTGIIDVTTNTLTMSGAAASTTGALTKTGAGKLVLSGANAYTGITTVSAGVLNLQNNAATGTTEGGIVVTSGAALELQGARTIGEALTLNGTGISNGGALRNIDSNSSWTGAITLGSASRINSDLNTLTLSGGITGTYSLTFGGAGNVTVNSVIGTGTGTITKDGTGTLTLSAANTYTGLTDVQAGTLAYGASNVIADGGSVKVSGGTLNIGTYSDTIAGLQLTSGTISGTTGVLTSTSNYDVQSGTVSAILGGTVGLNKTTSGTVTLSGVNQYTGLTTISGGSLVYGVSNAISTGGITINGADANLNMGTYSDSVGAVTLTAGSITGSGTLTSTVGFTMNNTSNTSVSAILAGAVGLTKSGTGTLTLSGVNTYTGLTDVQAGTLAYGANNVIANGNIKVSGGTLNITSYSDTVAGLQLTSGTISGTTGVLTSTSNYDMQSGSVSAILGGTVGLIKTTSGTVTLSGVNTYTGLTDVQAGTLVYGASNVIADAASIKVSGGTLNIGAYSDTVAGLQLTSGTITGTTGVLTSTSNYDVQSGTISAILGGTVGLNKTTSGTVTLSGVNQYTGLTTISAGSLAYGVSNAISTGGITINGADANLNMGAYSDTVGAVTLTQGSITGSGTLTSTVGFTMNNTSNTSVSAILAGAVGLTKSGTGTLTLSGVNTYTGLTDIQAGTLAYGASNVIANGANVKVSGGTLNIGAYSDSIAGLQLTSGTITGTTGVLTSTSHYDVQSGTVSAILGGTVGLNKTTSGTVTLSSVNQYTGLTTISAGSLVYGVSNAISTGGITINGADANLNMGTYTDTVGAVTLTQGSITGSGTLTSTVGFTVNNTSNTTISGVLAGAVGLTKSGTGTLTISSANTYTGLTDVQAGTLAYGASNVIADGASMKVSGGTLNIGAYSDTVAGLQLTSGTITGSTGVLTSTSNYDMQAGSVSAILGGSVGLNKTTSGTVTLSSVNQYTGLTTISAGSLVYGVSNAISTGGITINGADANLNMGTYSDTVGAVTLTQGSITGSGTLTSTVGFTMNNTSNTSVSAILAGAVGLTKSGTGILTLSNANTYTGVTTISGGIISVSTIGNGGVAGNLGQASNDADNLVFDGGTLQYTGASASTDRAFTINTGKTAILDVTANTLTISGAAASTGGALTKIGSGKLILSGANAYTGLTTVSAGVLNIQNDSATGTTAGGVSVTSGAALELQGARTIGAEALTLYGTGISNAGALRNIDSNSTWGGTITLGSASRINSDANTLTLSGGITGSYGLTFGGAGNVTVNSVISTGTGTIIKDGTGTLTLSGANTYTGLTDVQSGTLAYGASNVIADGASIKVSGGTLNIGSYSDTIAGLQLTSGTISGTTGVLTSTSNYDMQSGTVSAILGGTVGLNKTTSSTVTLSNVNQYTGLTTISAGSLVYGVSNAISTGGITINGADANLNMGTYSDTVGAVTLTQGSITGSGTLTSTVGFTMNNTSNTSVSAILAGSVGLTKSGTGTLTLSGVNTYTGLTDVQAGTLAYGVSNVIADGASVKVSGGTLNIGANSDTIAGLQLTSGTITGTTGVLTSTSTYDMQSGTVSAILGGSVGLNKTTSGTVTLSSVNTYTGLTDVQAGTLAYGVSNVIADGASVRVSGGTLNIGTYSDTVAGLQLTSGTITGSTGVLTSTSNYDVQSGTVSAILGGTVGLNKTTSGTVILSSVNQYTGLTTISGGSLVYGVSNAISTGGITINGADANLNMGTYSDTVGAVTLTAGSITGSGTLTSTVGFTMNNTSNTSVSAILAGAVGLTKSGTGTLTLSGANAYTGVTTISGGIISVSTIGNGGVAGNLGQASNMASNLVFDGGTLQYTGASASTDRAFTINSGKTAILDVTANTLTISGAAASTSGAFTKTGSGKLILSGANAYTGVTTVSAGVLNLQNDSATGTTAGGIVVASGAAIELQGTRTIGTEALTLNGTGIYNGGALRNIDSNSSWAGAITLGSASRINSDANTLTLSGGITGAYGLMFGGAGNVTVNSVISTGTGTITKDGTGTLTLSGVNTYTGLTDVQSGTLAYGASNVIANGASVKVSGGTLNIGTYSDTIAGLQLTSGSVTGSTGVLTSTTNYDLQSGSVSAILGGTVGLNKTTSGTVTLSGVNTYTGLTDVQAGILAYGANDVIADGSSVKVSGGTLNIGAYSDTIAGLQLISGSVTGTTGVLTSTTHYDMQSGTVSAILGGSVGLNKTTSSTVTLSGLNQYTGLTTISSGTLAYGASNAISTGGITINGADAILNMGTYSDSVGAVTLTAGSITGSGTLTSTVGFTMNNTSDTSVSAILGGSVGLIKSGTGTLTLSGVNTYTGLTDVQAGTLAYGASNVIANGASVKVSGGTLNIGAYSDTIAGLQLTSGTITGSTGVLTSTSNYEVQSGSISAILGGSVGLNKTTSGTVTLNSVNQYTGLTTISAGSLVYGVSNAISTGGITINGADANLNMGTYSDSVGAVTLTAGAITGSGTLTSTVGFTMNNTSNTSVSAILGGAVGLTKSGTGTLTLSGVNTYTGLTDVQAGTLAYGVSNVIANGASVKVSGGTLNIADYSDTIAGLQLTSGTITGTTGVLTSTSNYEVQAGTVSAILAGSVGLNKTTSGTVTLTAANQYTGLTDVQAGTLSLARVGGTIADTAAVQVSGGTLDVANSDTVGAVTLSSGMISGAGILTGSSYSLTNSGTISASLAGSASLTKSGAGIATLSGNNTYTGTTTVNAGTLILSGGSAIANTSAVTIANAAGAILRLNTSEEIGTLSGGGALGGNIDLQGNTLTVNQSSDAVYGGVMSGTGGSLIKAGANKLTLSGANTYTGTTIVNAGTLSLARSGGTLADTSSVQVNGGTLDIANSDTVGAVTLSSGTISGAGVLTASSYSFTNSGTISAILAGSATLTKSGAGTVTLTANNAYTGLTHVQAGTLSLARVGGTIADTAAIQVSGGTLDVANSDTVGAVTLSSGTISGAGTLTASSYSLTNSGTISAALAGSGTLTKSGAGTVILSGNNTYTGLTDVMEGILSLGRVGGTIADTASIRVSGGTLDVANSDTVGSVILSSGTISGAGTLTASSFSLTNSGTISAALAGSANLIKSGAGTVVLSGDNTYIGLTHIQAGILSLGRVGGTIADTAAILVTGGTLDVANSDTVGAVTLSGGTISGSGTLTASAYNFTDWGTVSTTLAGSGVALIKSGSGTVTLLSNNIYTGNTYINAGTLALSDLGSIANSPVIDIASGATLNVSSLTGGFSLASGQMLRNMGTIEGDLTVLSGATISTGDLPGFFDIYGDFNLQGTFLAKLGGLTAGTEYDQIRVHGGNVNLALGSVIELLQWNSFTPSLHDSFVLIDWDEGYNFTSNGYTFDAGPYNSLLEGNWMLWKNGSQLEAKYIGVIPEPGTVLMFALALMGLVLIRKTRKA